MPLCHWPCSCYPNHALGQVNDWMNEIYQRWVAAHGVMIVTPVYWYQAPSALKLMIDRLVCADGGNPDPTSTDGKEAEEGQGDRAGRLEYPKHSPAAPSGVVVHGDVAGIEGAAPRAVRLARHGPGAGRQRRATLDRYIGYYEPYATSHDALDRDSDLFRR